MAVQTAAPSPQNNKGKGKVSESRIIKQELEGNGYDAQVGLRGGAVMSACVSYLQLHVHEFSGSVL